MSNSSWANEGYLVASEIDLDDEFKTELKRLSTSFGIGIIKLDIDDPDSSEILFPAKEREVIDIETVNRLAEINPNFKDFLKRIKSDLNSREIRKEKYDFVLDLEKLTNKKGL